MIIPTSTAPRFHAWFEFLENRSVLLMLRQEWELLKVHHEGEIVKFDISRTPIARMTCNRLFIGTVAKQRSDYEMVLEVYRDDPKDAPTPINVDRYLVWEQLPPHQNYQEMVNAASTEDNANMRNFLENYVFMVKEPNGSGHWQSELPANIKACLRSGL